MTGYPKLTQYWHTTKEKWYVRVTWAPGDYTRHSLGTSVEAEVEHALDLFREKKLPPLGAGREHAAADPGPVNEIARAIKWFLQTHLRTLRRKPKTITDYTRILENFAAYCAEHNVSRGDQIVTRLIQEWQINRQTQRRRGEGKSAENTELMKLRTFLNDAQLAGELVLRNVVHTTNDLGENRTIPAIKWNIPPRPANSQYRAVPDAELRMFVERLDSTRPEFELPLRWMLHTPWLPSDTRDFRIGEDLGDKIDRRRIKTSRGICYPVTPELREIIERATRGRACSPTDPVFITHNGEPWTKDALDDRFYTWRKRHGFDICFRDLRVTWATNAAPHMHPNMLAELMGVEDVTTVYKYYVRVDLDGMIIAQKRQAQRLASLIAGEAPDSNVIPYILPTKSSQR